MSLMGCTEEYGLLDQSKFSRPIRAAARTQMLRAHSAHDEHPDTIIDKNRPHSAGRPPR